MDALGAWLFRWLSDRGSSSPCGKKFFGNIFRARIFGPIPVLDGTGPAVLFMNRGTASSSRLGSVSSTANVTFAKSWLKEFADTK